MAMMTNQIGRACESRHKTALTENEAAINSTTRNFIATNSIAAIASGILTCVGDETEA